MELMENVSVENVRGDWKNIIGMGNGLANIASKKRKEKK